MTDKIGQAEIKTKYPVTSGTASTDKHDGRKINLVAKVGTFVRKRLTRGIR